MLATSSMGSVADWPGLNGSADLAGASESGGVCSSVWQAKTEESKERGLPLVLATSSCGSVADWPWLKASSADLAGASESGGVYASTPSKVEVGRCGKPRTTLPVRFKLTSLRNFGAS